jgi:hypothetical protein
VNAAVRLLPIICACVVAQAFAGAAAPNSVGPEQPASQPSPAVPQDAATRPADTAPQSSLPVSDAAAKPSSPEKPSPAQSPTTGTSPTSPANGSTKVVLVDKTLTDAQVKELLSRGYRPQARGDDVVYCRREAVVGSRFESKICRSAIQIFQTQQDSKDLADHMQRDGGSPAGH